MADNKSLMTEINKHTRNIDKKVSRFGTKLPGNGNKEQAQKLEELSYEQMIMGTLASLVWGVNTKDKNKVKNLVTGNKSTIYSLLKDISENLSAKVSSKNVNVSNNLKNNNVNDTLIVDFANVQSVKDLNDLIKNLSSDKISNNTYVGLSSIIDLFKTLASNDLKDLAKTSAPNLKELSTLLNTYSGELNKIFTALNEIIKGKDLQFNLTSLSNIIDTIIKILEIDSSKINISGLVMLTNITDPKHGYIAELLKNLQESSRDIELTHESFIVLETFFNSLVSLVDIGFIKRRRIRNNVSFIKKYIINDIPDIIAQLDKVVLNNKETAYAAINTLSSLFTAISEISNLDINDRIRLLLNLKFIKKVYINEIVEILNKFQNIVNGDFISVLHALDSITKVFDMILKIGDISTFKLFKISFKTDAMIDIIEDSIESLIDIIINIKNTKQAALKIEEINRIFSAVQSIYESTPGLMKSVHESIKIQILQNNIDLLNDLVEQTNNMSKIKSHKLFESKLPKLINDILSIFGENTNKQIEDFNKTLIFFNNDIIKNLNKTIVSINEIPAITKKKEWIKSLKMILKEFDERGDEKGNETIGSLMAYTPGQESFKTFLQMGVSLKNFTSIISNFDKLDKEQQNNIKAILKVTKTIVEQFNESNKKSIAYNLSKVKDKDVEKIDTIITILKKLSELNKIKIILNISARTIREFAKIANPLKSFILKLASVKNRDIKKANKVIDTFIKIAVGGAAILLLGSLVMALVKPSNLILFTLTLGTFLTSLGLIFFAVHKGFKHSMKGARDAMMIAGIGAAIMIFGSWVTGKRFFAGALLFTVELGIFLTAIGLVFWLVNKGFKKTMKGAREAMFIVGTAALVLIIGSIAHNWYDFTGALLFTVELGLFLLALGGVFYLITPLFKGTYKSIKRALKVVALSALIMIGAQLIFNYLNVEKIFGFVLILGGFLLAIGLAFKITHNLIKHALVSVLLLTIVTTLAAGVLFFVGYLTKQHPEMLLCALGFALALVGYLAIIGLGFKFMKSLIPYIVIGAVVMTGIMLVTLIAIGVMYLMYAVCKQPSFFITIILGLLAMGIVFTVFGGLMLLLGSFIVDTYGLGGALLVVGGLALIGIIGVVALASLAMALMYWACCDEKFFITIMKGLAAMAIVFATFAAMIMGLGAIMHTGVGAVVFGLGVAALVTLEGVVGLAALVIKKIAQAVRELKTASVSEDSIKQMKNTVIGFAEILETLIDRMPWNPLKLAKLVTITEIMHKASTAISEIARGIKEYSTMKFASEFDEKGNPKKYISITNNDFSIAIKHIGEILTCVSNGLLSVAKDPKNKYLFDEGLFTKSPAYYAVQVAAKMGAALSSIAKGVKDWSEMKFVSKYDENGNPVEWKSITDGDLGQVGKNIETILTCLGNAIISTAKGNEDIFGAHWYDGILGNDTPAMNATKCVKMMGDVLTETATAVFAYSEGLLPVYDKDGHVLPRDQWQKLDLDDLKQGKESQLYKTINLILTSLGQAIIDVVKDDKVKDLFDTSFWNKLWGGGEGMNVATAIKDMATGLNTVVDVVAKLSEGNIGDAPNKIEKSRTVIVQAIRSLFNLFKDINGMFTEKRDDIETRNLTTDDSWIKGGINAVADFFGVDDEYRFKTENTVKSYVTYNGDNIKNVINYLDSMQSTITTLVQHIVDFVKTFKEKEQDLNTLDNISIVNIIQKIFKVIKDSQNVFTNEVNNLDVSQFQSGEEKINSIIDIYTNTINKLSSLAQKISSVDKENYNVLKDGIIKIFSASEGLTNVDKFNKYVDDLERFVNVINSVNISKISEFSDIITAMNNLTSQLNGMDQLTDTLSNKLSVVLFELVSELRKSETTIENAHKLQEKRKQLMEESIGKMRNILNQRMIVEIYQGSSNQSSSSPKGSVNGTTVSETTYSDTSDDNVLNTNNDVELPNPENATASKPTNTNGQYTGEKAMTFFEFKKYMESEFINNFRNANT